MTLRNRSNLPDDLFAALSPQGQRSANAIAQPAAAPQAPKPLSSAQRQALRWLADRDPNGYDFSDLRAVEILAERGFARHAGRGYLERTARYVITDAGRARMAEMSARATEPPSPGTAG